jgi:hypothetical protein
MRALFFGTAVAAMLLSIAFSPAVAADAPPDSIPSYMVIVATSTGTGQNTGVSIATLSFDTGDGCKAALSGIPGNLPQASIAATCVHNTPAK